MEDRTTRRLPVSAYHNQALTFVQPEFTYTSFNPYSLPLYGYPKDNSRVKNPTLIV